MPRAPKLPPNVLSGMSILLSASIPEPSRWSGPFDPYEITEAVAAIARGVLSYRGTLVSAAHPTIAPMLLYIAEELPGTSGQIVIYQSRLFADILPEATQRFDPASIRWVDAIEGETPEQGSSDQSLRIMRQTMIQETAPSAAIFVGGMEGILAEYEMLGELRPEASRYPIAAPGGEASTLADLVPDSIHHVVAGDVYPAIVRRIVANMTAIGESD